MDPEEVSMATVTLKNVPEELVQMLKGEAKQNRRSLEPGGPGAAGGQLGGGPAQRERDRQGAAAAPQAAGGTAAADRRLPEAREERRPSGSRGDRRRHQPGGLRCCPAERTADALRVAERDSNWVAPALWRRELRNVLATMMRVRHSAARPRPRGIRGGGAARHRRDRRAPSTEECLRLAARGGSRPGTRSSSSWPRPWACLS